jgi:aryl-alcohol dehydrogenase-like predicted oxidoreductase
MASERRGLARFRYREGGEQPSSGRMHWVPKHMTDPRNHDAVEQLVAIAEQAGLPLTHLTLAFVVSHPAVTSAIIGPAPWPTSTLMPTVAARPGSRSLV